MRRVLFPLAVVIFFSGVSVYAEKARLSNSPDDVTVTVLESDIERTVVRCGINAFEKSEVRIDQEPYFTITCGEESNLLIAGEPGLPRVCRSIIIPDDARMISRILSSTFRDFPETPVAPSKGNLLRTVDPDTVPYVFGSVYDGAEWYPTKMAALREPFILRDYRGTVVEINPFQYNPASRMLRVYESITIEITSEGHDNINVLERRRPFASVDPDFDLLYSRRFLNYEAGAALYTPVLEIGDMLIISYAAFIGDMAPLAEWKRQQGIKTTIVNVSSIGNSGTQIKNYIHAFYDSTDLAYVLLVGDVAQVATYSASGGASDPSYAKVAGTDNYPDIFVGRFSAENAGHVQTQVQRTITYERYPSGADWFHRASGIASDEGPGHNGGEYDFQHMNVIRTDLLAYNYTTVDQIYDPGATAAQVTNALNGGRGLVNYTGHGSSTSWGTTGFSNSNVNALSNAGKLPFIYSVACVNGEFNLGTCFAEAWLRATSGGNPIGAVATYMSSINQSWNPPMDAQDEAVDLLRTESKTTFGGICFNSSCRMIELNGTDGVEMFNTWHIFGDPSLLLHTDDPTLPTVTHSATVLFNATSFDVQVGVARARCALYDNGVIYGSAFTGTGGGASIPLGGALPVGEELTLTVTGLNLLPYIDSVMVIAPSGPYVIYDSSVVVDANGNNNGLADFGEGILLGVSLLNVGPDTSVNTTATLSTSDTYATITDASEYYGTIPGNNGTAYRAGGFAVNIASDVPDNHTIVFHLDVQAAGGNSWESDFSLVTHAPSPEFMSLSINDALGDGDGILDPGETANFTVILGNGASGGADSIVAFLSSGDPYISISDNHGYIGQLPAGGSASNAGDPFTVNVGFSCPAGRGVSFDLDILGERGFSSTASFDIIVGARSAIYSDDFSGNQGWTGLGGAGEWTIGPANGGTGSDTYGGPDPASDHSPTSDDQVLGNDLTSGTGGDYAASLTSTYWVTSPTIDCSQQVGVRMSFYRWLGVEGNTYDHAYLQAFNGTSWVALFLNSATTIDESSWSLQEYDLAAVADSNANFKVRFGIGATDGAWQFCGWNIDDIVIEGYLQTMTFDPEMALSPAGFTDSLVQGDACQRILTVRNIGNGDLLVTFQASQGWITCFEGPNTIPPSDSLNIVITINSATLEPGTHAGSITFSSNDTHHSSGSIPVTLEVIGGCQYIAGDANGNGAFNGIDVSYCVSYLKGSGDAPPNACDCPPHGLLYAAADANGNCQFNGIDVTYCVAYLKGIGPAPQSCADCPPAPAIAPGKVPIMKIGAGIEQPK